MYRHVLVFATICLLTNKVSTDTNYRLNTPIRPSSYSIVITPYFDTNDDKKFTYDGEININFKTESVTNEIKLHSEDLNFTDVTVSNGTVNIPLNGTWIFNTTYTFVYINLQTDLQVGVDYTLKITYQGKIRDDLNGFYRNYYIENGVKKWLGATQMEPTHARKAFPCFDEPDLKATFNLTIDRPANYKPSLANTKLQSSVILSNGYIREIFYPTPKMSTYLVAFLVSEFEVGRTNVNDTRPFGVYARPEATNQTDYAYDFGQRVVNALGDYFGIDYYSVDSNLKLDHVALPNFRAGAMENWGLIKYREALLLYVAEDSTPYYKYRVAQIIAHETTHMWFGNLITCHWWSDTWLNEGFANYFQDYITYLIEPEVGSGNILVTGSVYEAYTADQVATAPAITNNNVNSPAEISGHFGTITYQKAGSVIRMIHHLLGDDAFKFGLNNYLNNNKFDVGYPDRLYSALNQGASNFNALSLYPGFNISDILNSWISQAGHPILEVEIDHEDDKITLKQRRFYIDSSQRSNEVYKIPITYTTGISPNFNYTKPVFIMENEEYVFTIANISQEHTWVIFNIQETGFYRVNYDEHSWQHIASALKGDSREDIHHLNRAKIVNDLFAFLYADEVEFSLLYHVLEFLADETDYSVWYAALRGLNNLRNSYLGTDVLNDIDDYALSLLEGIINKLGYDVKSTDDIVTLRNRMQILEFACKIGHQGCIENSIILFKEFKENGTEISPSLRPVAYCNGLRYGNGEDYDFLYQRMSTTNVANEARLIIDVLGCSADDNKLRSYLISVQEEDSPILSQDLTMPLAAVLANYNNVHIVLESLQQNYTLWTQIYPAMDTVLSQIAAALHTEDEFNQFESWLSLCTQCSLQTVEAAEKALASAKASTAWAEKHRSDVLRSLRNNASVFIPSLTILVITLMSVVFVRL